MTDIVERLRDTADMRHMDRGNDAVDDIMREAAAEIEHLRLSLSEARATGRREGLEEAAKIVEEDTRPALARTYRHNPVWFVYAKQRAAAIRAAMEKEE